MNMATVHVNANAAYGDQLQFDLLGGPPRLRIRLPFHVQDQALGNFAVDHAPNNEVLLEYEAYGQGF